MMIGWVLWADWVLEECVFSSGTICQNIIQLYVPSVKGYSIKVITENKMLIPRFWRVCAYVIREMYDLVFCLQK